MMIVPRSQGVLNLKCIFRKKMYFQREKKTYNNSFNLTGDIYCTIPKEQDKLLRASAHCLFIWHISMKGGFLPTGGCSLLYRILLLRSVKLLFQIQYIEIHSNLNYGIKKSHYNFKYNLLVYLAKSRILPLRLTSTLYQKTDTCTANYLFLSVMAHKNYVKAWITKYGNNHYMGKIFLKELYNDHKVKSNFENHS